MKNFKKYLKKRLWHRVSNICTRCSAKEYYYADKRYGNYNREVYLYYAWWYIQWLKLLKKLDG